MERSPIKQFPFKKWKILNHICGSGLRKWQPGLGVLRALSCREMSFFLSDCYWVWLWKTLPLEPVSALTCSYFYPHRVEQWISIPLSSLIPNSSISLKAAPTALRHISSPVCPGGLDSVSSPLGGILHCRDWITVLHGVLSFQTQTFGAVPVISSCHSELHPPI